MPIELYPNIAKVKRNGVYQNLPGFVQASGDTDIKAMIATSETSTTAQYAHLKGYYFILNDILYQADEDIAVNDIIAVGTNCHIAVLADGVTSMINAVDTVNDLNDQINGVETSGTIQFSATRGGYISKSGDNVYLLTAPITSHCVMLINDLSAYRLAEGSVITFRTGYGGTIGAIGFSNSEIADSGHVQITSCVEFPNTDSIQTVTAIIPQGTVGIALYDRPAALSLPTISYVSNSGDGLEKRVEVIENEITEMQGDIEDIEEEISVIKYHTLVKKPMDFANKNLVFFGDSITYGYIRGSGGQPATQATNQYPKVFSEGVGANSYSNQGANGTCIYGSESYQIANIVIAANLSTYDYVFIAGGVNDWQTGVTEAQLESAMESMCSHLSTTYNGEVIFITPINEAGREPSVTPTQTLQNVRNVITRIALKYGFSVVQGWEFPFPIEDDDTDYIDLMFQDKLHPTELGYSMYAKALRNAVC